ncbi:hypothetical protein GUJ93_ZPchr0255g33287 [Zizania palustris]|uniref:Uncharacterized protein n=1 Tax=Zizania palustris TaxID=103762 RepID=A0A8J5R1G2_ZIZPA|nr:hypothetical protein GUJ93_ZPchr0255g33287 [Zizania palustris]
MPTKAASVRGWNGVSSAWKAPVPSSRPSSPAVFTTLATPRTPRWYHHSALPLARFPALVGGRIPGAFPEAWVIATCFFPSLEAAATARTGGKGDGRDAAGAGGISDNAAPRSNGS